MHKQEKPLSMLWGCELGESKMEETFKTDDTNYQHQLVLRTMCLGAGAKAEFNIVELLTGEPDNGKGITVATLHASGMPMVNLSGLELHPPVTFRLKSGAGPVYICGEHIALEDDFSGIESGDEEMEDEEEDIEESPVKPKKALAKSGDAAGKKKKPEAADEPVSDDENPPQKGKGRGKGRGK
ncbi:nucleoplasmin-like [Oncorhynchus keta]|uniref:nucleoplasmin-like n=1 Tax=Oncorhynchus keta TaxID=8018 RepID=UPI0015F856D9|nr:nucleoplasmin-like [Oncorhynchus keta]XP_035628445.1 nucleoplasmin-like [Oncorhynchus keta]